MGKNSKRNKRQRRKSSKQTVTMAASTTQSYDISQAITQANESIYGMNSFNLVYKPCQTHPDIPPFSTTVYWAAQTYFTCNTQWTSVTSIHKTSSPIHTKSTNTEQLANIYVNKYDKPVKPTAGCVRYVNDNTEHTKSKIWSCLAANKSITIKASCVGQYQPKMNMTWGWFK